ncbi:MAG: 3-hexulose-6-phosphate synthase [Candidatus Hydrothermarchaeota archaeon]
MIIQLALDLTELDRAIKIAKEAGEYVKWVEAGTPLIKSEGVEAIRKLRKAFPDKKIVADMKTVDTGAIEVEMATKAGADIVILLASAQNTVILEALKSASRYGSEIMVDLMDVENKAERAKELEELGVHYILVHTGIDEQMAFGKNPIEEFKKVREVTKIPTGIAGGIDVTNAREAVESGSDFLVIGGAIIKDKNPREAARRILSSIEGAEIKVKRRASREEEIFEILKKVSTPNIANAMHNQGIMKGIRPVFSGIKMVGRALTVRVMDGDWAKTVEAIDEAKEGDVIVIDAGGGKTAVWGELASYSCKNKGVAGVVIDGTIRDVDEIMEIKFPSFARYIYADAGEPKGFGEIGVEITCGGQRVKPGDIIVGDDNGVAVIPKENALEIANRAYDNLEFENRVREEIIRGGTLSSILKIKKWEKVR